LCVDYVLHSVIVVVYLMLLQQKKIELRASLIQELEHKKKMIENERNTMELTGG